MADHVEFIGERRNSCRALVERQKETGHMENPEVGWRTILNFISDKCDWLYGLSLSGSGYGIVTGSCEQSNELSSSIKYWQVLGCLRN
jgi:hypothetical protein